MIHLVKLCVGCDTVEELQARRRARAAETCVVHTRQTPRRADELKAGGSLYWVFKGAILCRQTILAVETEIDEGRKSCAIFLDPLLVRVAPSPRRPFQGWRYLELPDAPPDLGEVSEDAMPEHLARRLREIGAW